MSFETSNTWSDFKLKLLSTSPWLDVFVEPFGSSVAKSLATITATRYERLLVEPMLRDISSGLDRCLAYRKEAHELDIAAVKSAVDYELFLNLTTLDIELEQNALGNERLTEDVEGYLKASDAFASRPSDLSEGFRLHDGALSRSASVGLNSSATRQTLLAKRWDVLKRYHAEYNLRHTSPGNAHNYRERFQRLLRLFEDDLLEVYEKALAVALGFKTIYGIELPTPDTDSPEFLDSLVLWARRCIQTLDLQGQSEVAYDVVIPIAQPWRLGKGPLVDSSALWNIIEANTDKKIVKFDLSDVFFNQRNTRVRSIGIAFGASPTSANDTTMDRYAYWRLRAVIHAPPQPDIVNPGTYYSRPPIVFGNVAVFGRSVPVATESGLACYNVNPSGKWKIVINSLGVWSDENEANVEGGLFTRIIRDLKLHMRVVSMPLHGSDTVFLP